MSSGSSLAQSWIVSGKRLFQYRGSLREKENNSNKTSVRPGEQKTVLCSRVCANVQVGMKGTFLPSGGLWHVEQFGLHLDWRQKPWT